MLLPAKVTIPTDELEEEALILQYFTTLFSAEFKKRIAVAPFPVFVPVMVRLLELPAWLILPSMVTLSAPFKSIVAQLLTFEMVKPPVPVG